jgi:hypothetical protein
VEKLELARHAIRRLVQYEDRVELAGDATEHGRAVAELQAAAKAAAEAFQTLDLAMVRGEQLPQEWSFYWRIGESDPTKFVVSEARKGRGTLCGEPVRGELTCTRLKDHGGFQHVAGDGVLVVAVSQEGS